MSVINNIFIKKSISGEVVDDINLAKDILYAGEALGFIRDGNYKDIYFNIKNIDLGPPVSSTDSNANNYLLRVSCYGPNYMFNGPADPLPFSCDNVKCEDTDMDTSSLDNYERRRDTYKKVITEAITQPDLYRSIVDDDHNQQKLIDRLKDTTAVSKDVTDLINVIQAFSGNVYVSPDTTQFTLKQAFAGRASDKVKIGKHLNLLSDALDIGEKTLKSSSGTIRFFIIKSLAHLPETEERLETLKKFVELKGSSLDPAFVEAVTLVEQDLEDFETAHYDTLSKIVQDASTNPEVLLSVSKAAPKYISFFIKHPLMQAGVSYFGALVMFAGIFLFEMEVSEAEEESTITSTLYMNISSEIYRTYENLKTAEIVEYNSTLYVHNLINMRYYLGYHYYKTLNELWKSEEGQWHRQMMGNPVGAPAGSSDAANVCRREGIEYAIGEADSKMKGLTYNITPPMLFAYEYDYDQLTNLLIAPVSISSSDIKFDPNPPQTPGTTVRINLTIHNDGNIDTPATYALHQDYIDTTRGRTTIGSGYVTVPAHSSVNVTVTWYTYMSSPETHMIWAWVSNLGYWRRAKTQYSLGGPSAEWQPKIIEDFPNINLTPGNSKTIDLDDYVEDKDNANSELNWEYDSSSNIRININPTTHIVTFTAPAAWQGTEKILLKVTDPKGYSDSKYIFISSVAGGELTNGQVSPSSGTVSTLFTYSVVYKNLDNRLPIKKNVIINGVPYKMEKSSGVIKEGATFTLKKYLDNINSNANWFYFEFNDGTKIYMHPKNGLLEEPNVTIIHDLKLEDTVIIPSEPKAGEKIKIQFRVNNIGTIHESNVTIKFYVNNILNNSKNITVLWMNSISELTTFEWAIPILDYTETYNLKVEVVPANGETNTGDNNYTTSLTIVPEPGSVSGYVFDEVNNPVEDAVVKVIESTAEDYGSAKSGYYGYYKIDGLMPGTYKLEAYKESEGNQTKAGVAVHSQQETQAQNFNLYAIGTSQLTSGDYDDEDPFWSPDGNNVVFDRIGANEEIIIHDKNGAFVRRLTGSDKTVKNGRRPEYSPDGTKILMDGNSDSQTGVWIMSSTGDGSDAALIATTGFWPTYSPDGSKVAYRFGSETWTANNDGSGKVKLADGDNRELAWSPDGTRIAFANNLAYLGIINASTGAVTTLLSDKQYGNPAWLPDSSGLLFDAKGSDYDIYLLYLNGVNMVSDPIRITFGTSNDRSPSMPRSGPSKLGFFSDRGIITLGKFAVNSMNFMPPKLFITNISASPDPFTPNEDGTNDYLNISFVINKNSYATLKIYDSQSNFIRTLVNNTFLTAGYHSFLWNGKNQDNLTENAEVYFYRLDAHDAAGNFSIPAYGRATMLAGIKAVGNSYNRFSSDGKKLVYVQSNVLKTVYSNGTNEELKNVANALEPDWSRDDSKFVLSTTGEQIATINNDNTSYTEVTSDLDGPTGYSNNRYPKWSPAQDKIVYRSERYDLGLSKDNHDIYLMNSDGGSKTRLTTNNESDNTPAWSPDGTKIIFTTGRSGVPFAAGGVRTTDIWLMNSDGSGKRQLTYNPYQDNFPEFAPDASHFLFGSNRHTGISGGLDLWIMKINGTNTSDPKALAEGFSYGEPSQNGSEIAVNGYILSLFLSLTKGAIEGKVIDYDTSEDIDGATVKLLNNSVNILNTTTNSLGGFQFLNIEPGIYMIKAEKSGYSYSEELPISADSWEISRENTIKLSKIPSLALENLSAKINGIVTLSSFANDTGVKNVTYQYSASNWTTIGTVSFPYTLEWDIRNFTSKDYKIRAIALDELNTTGTSLEINITVDNTAPAAYISNMKEGEIINGNITLNATASGETDSVIFEYKLKDDIVWIPIGSVDTEEPYSVNWDATHLTNGAIYNIRAVAMDELGNRDNGSQEISGITPFSIQLRTGWNLISIPLNLTNKSPSYAFSSIDSLYSGVFSYGKDWLMYDPGNVINSNLKNINNTIGLWIKMNNYTAFMVNGSFQEKVNFSLKKGLNLIAYPSLTTKLVNETFNVSFENILTYNGGNWESYSKNKPSSFNTLDYMTPGQAYWIKLSSDANWTFNGTFSQNP